MTGVQTCALPIFDVEKLLEAPRGLFGGAGGPDQRDDLVEHVEGLDQAAIQVGAFLGVGELALPYLHCLYQINKFFTMRCYFLRKFSNYRVPAAVALACVLLFPGVGHADEWRWMNARNNRPNSVAEQIVKQLLAAEAEGLSPRLTSGFPDWMTP